MKYNRIALYRVTRYVVFSTIGDAMVAYYKDYFNLSYI